jgi:hypothetical protein
VLVLIRDLSSIIDTSFLRFAFDGGGLRVRCRDVTAVDVWSMWHVKICDGKVARNIGMLASASRVYVCVSALKLNESGFSRSTEQRRSR